MDDFVSLLGGALMMVSGTAVVMLYWRHLTDFLQGGRSPQIWFGHAVAVGFMSAAFNAFYWKFVYRIAHIVGAGDTIEIMVIAGPFFDLICAGLPFAWAAWGHLKSAHLSLDASERSQWSPVTICFYPTRNAFVRAVDRSRD